MTADTRPLVAIVAPGNMGAAVGARLTASGLRVLTSLDGRSATTRERAAEAGMTAASAAEIAGADILLSIVPPGKALGVAEALMPALRASNHKPLFVECNAVSPQTVGRIAAVIAEAGCPFVDGGIMGPPPRVDSKRTRLYVSGPDAAQVGELNKYGLNVRVMGGKVGDASALKLSYAAFNKGVVALGAIAALAAERAGVGDALRAEFAESQPGRLTELTRTIPDMLPKAYRWVAEFEEIAQFTGGSEAEIFKGIARLYDRVAADVAGAKAEAATLTGFYKKAADTPK
jgi:3-hydroxyisobutyrate dehydrogenase-like beta-hydroxyacid dehydrogenase